MPPASSSSSPSSASDYIKVHGVPGLYRNIRSGVYLGLKKVEGKRKERSLKTNDRKIAERRLKAWIDELGKVDTSVEKTTLEELFAKLLAVSADKSACSLDIIEGVRDEFLVWWPYGSKFQVCNVCPPGAGAWMHTCAQTSSCMAWTKLGKAALGRSGQAFSGVIIPTRL